MSSIKFKLLSIFFASSIILSSCNSEKWEKINENLGIQLNASVSEVEFNKINLTLDYNRPYYVIMKFKIDSTGVKEIITKTNLVSNKMEYKNALCLENVDSFFIKKLWNFEISDYVKKQAHWWNPDISKNFLLYASFYKVNGAKKIENCYLNNWDGRILLGYNREASTVYILIEVYGEEE